MLLKQYCDQESSKISIYTYINLLCKNCKSKILKTEKNIYYSLDIIGLLGISILLLPSPHLNPPMVVKSVNFYKLYFT